jgi:miniconductance mechanosensitive channel
LEKILNIDLEALGLHASLVGGNILLALVAMYLTRVWLMRGLKYAVRKTTSSWDDALFDAGFFRALSWLVPVVIVHLGSSAYDELNEDLGNIMRIAVQMALVLAVLRIIGKVLDATLIIYRSLERAKAHPIKGYIQLAKILVNMTGVILLISILIQKSPIYLLSGLGAMTAVLMLIFKDTLLSLVASMQITTQKLIRVGDWIEVASYKADGDVVDVALHTITVQNWDKTLVTIPTSQLINDGFKNWRGMSDSGGRRIKRHLLFDMRSVRFLETDELESLKKVQLLGPYLEERLGQIQSWNEQNEVDLDNVVNGRRLTNLGCFREYLQRYLEKHPMIHKPGSMTFLVRQLQPSDKGIGIELYVFTRDTRWVNYEGIQADIFDHILAVVGTFDLRLFQSPTDASLERGLSEMASENLK